MDQLSPEQRQAVLIQAQQEANQRIMQDVSREHYLLCLGPKKVSEWIRLGRLTTS
jgi:hypothetical protein